MLQLAALLMQTLTKARGTRYNQYGLHLLNLAFIPPVLAVRRTASQPSSLQYLHIFISSTSRLQLLPETGFPLTDINREKYKALIKAEEGFYADSSGRDLSRPQSHFGLQPF
jgi:hypothetical protein